MFLRLLTWIFIIWVIYGFVKSIVKGIFKVTINNNGNIRNMQDQLRDLHQKVNEQKPPQQTNVDGEYIDYEEVK